MASQVLKIRQTKSASKCTQVQKDTLRALGLRGRDRVVYRTDLRAIRGMLNRVHHMIEAEQVDSDKAPAKKQGGRGIQVKK